MDDIEYLKQSAVRKFILANEHVDIQKLILNPPAAYKKGIRLIADQLISRNKLKNKLPQWMETETILPPPTSLEQASSNETATYKAQLIKGDLLVDLTGGMGVDTIALSHSFESSVYVENNPWLCQLFSHNQQFFSDKQIAIHQNKAEVFLEAFNGKASFFIDPSRRVKSKKVYLLEECEPNILDLLPRLKEASKEVLIKVSPMMDIKMGIRQLKHVKSVHVVSVRNECKEVLFRLDYSPSPHPIDIICVDFKEGKEIHFEFNLEEEQEANPIYGKAEKYLYDPNTSILKAGAFKSIATKYGLKKIARHTHLYTSDSLIENFPGRTFEVTDTSIKQNSINRLLPDGKANVITKNYPLKVEQLKKKLKVQDGGEFYLIGFRDDDDQKEVVLCKRTETI